jgi:hypothetical protein
MNIYIHRSFRTKLSSGRAYLERYTPTLIIFISNPNPNPDPDPQPLTYVNDLWVMHGDTIEIDDQKPFPTDLTFTLRIGAEVNWKFWLQYAIREGLQAQIDRGVMSEKDVDDTKRIFVESNPYYLALTTVVSLVHTVFDLLAFRSDIGFWNNNKSMEGLSAGSVVLNAVMQVVIFLYLLDNDTSSMILFSTGLSLLIEFWKITKVFRVAWTPRGTGVPLRRLFPYRLTFSYRTSYVESRTKQYDQEAMRYLSYVMFPLLAGYAVYDLIYGKNHTSWYSWTLATLVGGVYLFGFILMCPQLYLNYKLKRYGGSLLLVVLRSQW